MACGTDVKRVGSRYKPRPLGFYFYVSFIIFICFWLRWVFAAVPGLSAVVASGSDSWLRRVGARVSHCGPCVSYSRGFSGCVAAALGAWADSCDAQARLRRGM
ncbi:unnamed protein product [Rangifer tarandus platyrhynchus]|uniref:Uncharacterized protein n=1 Tax=Rangifer tarandus platyrhynchus TaxID=3082113 RepID=A0ACB1KHF8_RANTA